MTIPILRPYQRDLCVRIYDSWNQGATNVLAVMGTGMGKTVTLSQVVHDHRGLSCVIAHRQELVSQLSMSIARFEVMHRIIAPKSVIASIVREHQIEFGRTYYNANAHAAVAGVDTLVARQDALSRWAQQVTLWVTDECFVAGTMISMPDGEKPIETIIIGDIVLAFNEVSGEIEQRAVTRLFKKAYPPTLYKINLSTHHQIYATSEHPFWTQRGWVNACDITLDDQLFMVRGDNHQSAGTSTVSYEEDRSGVLQGQGLRIQVPRFDQMECSETREGLWASRVLRVWDRVRDALYSISSTAKRFANLLWESLFKCVSGEDTLRGHGEYEQEVRIGANEGAQPDAKRGNSFEDVKDSPCHGASTVCSRWERQGAYRRGVDADGHRRNDSPCNLESRHGHKDAERQRLSDALQDRRSDTESYDSNRGGWGVTPVTNPTSIGRKEGFVLDWVRVEGIEILQSGNHAIPGDGNVYNIEVDGLHTYIADGVVVHNCHHVLRENKWGTATSMFPHARGLGVTATPQRADGKGLGAHSHGVFHTLIEGPSVYEAIQMGNLCKYRIVAPPSDFDVDHIKVTTTGDFSGKEMREAARKSHITGDVVEHYIRFAWGKTGITFATDVETANEIAAQYRQAGVPCQAVSAETPEHVRNDFVRRFKRGDLKQLVNVDLFGEGFDLPNLEVVSLARPTMSLAVAMQQIGRAMRPSPGKDRALIIDHVGNVKRHGLPDIPRRWTLDAREKRSSKAADPDAIPLTACLSCYEVYERFRPACPHCGYKHQPDARRRPDQVDGDLAMLDDDVLEAMRQAAIDAMETPESLAGRVGYVAGDIAAKGAANRQREKIEAQTKLREIIAIWAGQQRSLGRPDDESYRRFFLTFGIDVLSAQALGRSEAEKLAIDIQTALG